MNHSNRILRNANTWRQQYDALRFLDVPKAVALLEQERRGIHSETQYVYDLVDSIDADMLALIQLRLAAIKRLSWKVVKAPAQTAGYDEQLATAQERALNAFYNDVDNLKAALADMALATFRGFSIVQIQRGDNGMPARLYPLDRWLFARDGMRGSWYWNPEAQNVQGKSLDEANRIGSESLPLGDFLIREVVLSVDRVALLANVRSSTVEKDWDAWCEMYGLHPAIITEPPGTLKEDRPHYESAARAFSDGQGGVLPHASEVDFPNSVTVQAPFEDRGAYLTRKKVLAGTSGMLTMLAESGSGTLAGGAHQKTFDTLAAAEAEEITEIFQTSLDAPILAALFPNQPQLAWFELQPYRDLDPDNAATRVSNLAQYFRLDLQQASEEVGLSLVEQIEQNQTTNEGTAMPLLNSDAPGTHLPPLVNAAAPDAAIPDAATLEGAAVDALAEARAAGLSDLVERILIALQSNDETQLRTQLQEILDSLPAMVERLDVAAQKDAEIIELILQDAIAAGYHDATATKPGPATKQPSVTNAQAHKLWAPIIGPLQRLCNDVIEHLRSPKGGSR